MGMLMNFLGGAAQSLKGSIDEDRMEKRRAEDDARQFQQQISWAKSAAAIQHNMKAKTEVQIPTPYGNPIQRGPGNWEQPTKLAVPALLDEGTGDVVRAPEFRDGPFMPAPDPNALTPKDQATIDQRDRAAKLAAETRLKAAGIRGSGGSRGDGGADRRATESNTRRDRDGLEQATERRLADVRAELKGLSRDVDEETGFSPFDDALQRRGLPMGLNYTDAIELERKRINDELAPGYSGAQGGGKAASVDKPDAAQDNAPYREGETIYDQKGRKHIVKNGVPVPV